MKKIINKKSYLIIGICLLCISLLIINYFYFKNKAILKNNLSKTNNLENIAIMLETEKGSGIYTESLLTTWPTSGYLYNSSKSYCLNGSTITYDSVNKLVNVKAKGFEKCYIYFDAMPDVYATVSTNGTSGTSVVGHANYDVLSSCTVGSSTFNKKDWSLDVTLLPDIRCSVTYTTNITNSLLNNTIMDLSIGTCSDTSYTTGSTCKNNGGIWTTTVGSGYCTLSGYTTEATCMAAGVCSNTSYTTESTCTTNGGSWANGNWYAVFNENGFRYEGKDPNNYIWFNNEMWRIIGVFDSTNHGQTGNLVKIIRNDVLETLVWNYASGVTWGDSSLKLLFNNYYYQGLDYPYDYTSTANACSSQNGYVIANCDYTQNGITNVAYRNMIANVRWNNTSYSTVGTVANAYANDIVTTTSSTGYIGLIYASDYGYGVLESVCARTIALADYNGSTNGKTCTGQNWLFNWAKESTISQCSTSEGWHISYGGYVSKGFIFYGDNVRPALYLSSSVYVLDGDGSYNNPYIIGM